MTFGLIYYMVLSLKSDKSWANLSTCYCSLGTDFDKTFENFSIWYAPPLYEDNFIFTYLPKKKMQFLKKVNGMRMR